MCHGRNSEGDTLSLTIPEGSVVTSIRLFNRNNYFGRLNGAEVKVNDVLCGTVENAGSEVNIECGFLTGNTVTITTINKQLNLMEVQIFGRDNSLKQGDSPSEITAPSEITSPPESKF